MRRARPNCARRSWLVPATRANPLRRPEVGFEILVRRPKAGFIAAEVLVLDVAGDTIGGLTVQTDGTVHAAAAVRGFGPLVYDAAATALGVRLRPSRRASKEAQLFWTRQGGSILPLSSDEWREKYGVPFEQLRVPDDIANRRMDFGHAMFEVVEVAQHADDLRYGRTEVPGPPRLPLERGGVPARASRPVRAMWGVKPGATAAAEALGVALAKPKAKPNRARRKPRARPNPTAASQPLLLDVLAHLHALRWLYWTTHWTAAGPNFYSTHLLLQRLYEGKGGGPKVDEEMDQLGERMVAYFGTASIDPGKIQQRSSQVIAEHWHGNPLRGLLQLEESLQVVIRRAWEAEQSAGDKRSLGIDDYLMGLANERDTARYLLRRTLE